MIFNIEGITIFSPGAETLAEFYKEKIGLEPTFEGVMNEDTDIYEFDIGTGTVLRIIDHSEVKGTNKEPDRIIINFEVEDIQKEVKRLDMLNIKKIQDLYHVEDYGQIATYEDPDGNYFQLVQTKEGDGE